MSYESEMSADAHRWRTLRHALATKDERIIDAMEPITAEAFDSLPDNDAREKMVDDAMDEAIKVIQS